MADIPDGVNRDVAAMAIAWEMVKQAVAQDLQFQQFPDDEKIKRFRELYAMAFWAINSPKQPGS